MARMSINFAVFPYLVVKRSFKVGNYYFWTDTNKNWTKYLNATRPSNLLKIYKDRKGKIIKKMTILSSPNEINLIKLNELVSILHFLSSNALQFSPKAESFQYDSYIKNNQLDDDTSHTRVDKFVRAIINNNGFKIYQNPEDEVFKINFDDREKKYLRKLKIHFLNNTKMNIIRGLPFYFRTQYRNTSHFPEIEDIQNFATAFEILYEIGDGVDKANLIADKLFNHFSDSTSENKLYLKKWFKDFYDTRSSYTHGGDIATIKLNYLNQRHIDIAKVIYCEAVKKFLIREKGRAILNIENSILTKLFQSQKIFNEVVSSLSPNNRGSDSGKKNLDRLINCSVQELALLSRKMVIFYVDCDRRNIDVNSERRLKGSLKTLSAIVKTMIEDYENLPNIDQTKYNAEPLVELKNLPLDIKTDSEMESVYSYFNNPRTYSKIIYSKKGRVKNILRELTFRDVISISTVSDAFTNLYLVLKYRGL